MVALEKWKRDLKELDEQENPSDRISDKYRMVALKQLLGSGTRVREYVMMKEAEGAISTFEEMLKVVQQWAEQRRLESSKDMDVSNVNKEEGDI